MSHLSEQRELPDLRQAMIAAHGVARRVLRRHRLSTPLHGTLDIEDEAQQPVARILLTDLARQIS
nr:MULTISPECIES: hypothetical protein [unclassified Sphingomonas]